MQGSENIDQADDFTYLGIIIKDSGCDEDIKGRLAMAQGLCSRLKNVGRTRKISVQIKIKILEATLMILVTYDSETWVLGKTEEYFKKKIPKESSKDFFV